jgi:hypothetical protein
MNMTFEHVPTPEDFEKRKDSQTKNVIMVTIGKEIFIALGNVGTHCFIEPFMSSTSTYYMVRVRWYLPCSVEYQR